MDHHVLVTGATGALGPYLLAEILQTEPAAILDVLIRPPSESLHTRWDSLLTRVREAGASHTDVNLERLRPLVGDICQPGLGINPADSRRLARYTAGVVHAAADTRFRAPTDEQRQTNVEGTRILLDWAEQCPGLRLFLMVSTTCVAGNCRGPIPEDFLPEPAGFTNNYERTKWQAERLAKDSRLPVRVLRLSTALGSERTGAVYRQGALHHALRWFSRGLVPMVPGTADTPVDLISCETASRLAARALALPHAGFEVIHGAAGRRALPLGELLGFVADYFKNRSVPWRRGQLDKPLIVDESTFQLFCRTIQQCQDALFSQVLDSLNSFLPALLHPKTYDTTRAEALWGGPLPLQNPKQTLERVLDFCLDTSWGQREITGGRSWQVCN